MADCRFVILIATAVSTLYAAPAQAQPRSERDIAVRFVAELRQPLYGRSRVEWKKTASSATWQDRGGPRDHPPASVTRTHRGLWCSEAIDSAFDVTRVAVFYGLRSEAPYDCRLEQVRYQFGNRADVRVVYDALLGELRNAFDDGYVADERDRAEFDVAAGASESSGYPAGVWEDVRYWFTPTGKVFLFRNESSVQVLAQSAILESALALERNIPSSLERYGTDLLAWEVVNALRSSDAEASDLILSNDAVPEQELVRRSALRLLKRRAQAKGDERSLLSLAASLVLGKLFIGQVESEEAARRAVAEFAAFGIGVGLEACSWVVTSDLDASVIKERPRSWWGQLASYAAVAGGGDPFSGRQYRYVVDEGPRWLKANPRSRLTIPMMFVIAKGYETWWSLSMAPDDEEFVTHADHLEGADRARLGAIRWYERIIREAPTSVEALKARRVLIQIIVGVDTGERMFFQVYA